MTGTFTVNFLSGKRFVLPVVEGETVRKFNLRMSRDCYDRDLEGQETSNIQITVAVDSKGVLINRADWRHRLLSDIINFNGNDVRFFVCEFPSPNVAAQLVGNLKKDAFIPDLETCSICLEEYSSRNSTNMSNLWTSLKCLHRFHGKCIAKALCHVCPLCREPIEDWLVQYLQQLYSRE